MILLKRSRKVCVNKSIYKSDDLPNVTEVKKAKTAAIEAHKAREKVQQETNLFQCFISSGYAALCTAASKLRDAGTFL